MWVSCVREQVLTLPHLGSPQPWCRLLLPDTSWGCQTRFRQDQDRTLNLLNLLSLPLSTGLAVGITQATPRGSIDGGYTPLRMAPCSREPHKA